MQPIELGIIDTIWRVSLYPHEEPGIDFYVDTAPGKGNHGGYRAWIGWNGTFISENRILPDGNYDPHPETNRPTILHLILAAIPQERNDVKQAFKKAYQLEEKP